jgi:hypothetical protein
MKKPAQVSADLYHIASEIENTESPQRNYVIENLRRILASIEENNLPVVHPLTRISSWWDEAKYPTMGDTFSYSPKKWIGVPLLQRALSGGPPLQYNCWEGNLSVDSNYLVDKIQKLLNVRIVQIDGGVVGSFANATILFSSEVTMVQLDLRGKYGMAHIATISDPVMQNALTLFNQSIIPDDPNDGLVFVLTTCNSGYTIRQFGVAGSPIERGNYSSQVLQDYDHVVSDLNTMSPCGRLSVLAGEPGTGKTYLIKSLLKEAPKAAFIIIPAHMIEDVMAPDILPALSDAKRKIDGPIILIIEDGDRCLVPRESGDMNAISSLLNLGDGILGSILDIRLIVTTNAKKVQMDPAISRPGRLCKYMEVGALDPIQAGQVLHRLTGQYDSYQEPQTLASIYHTARQLGWKPPQNDESTMESNESKIIRNYPSF